MTTRLETAPRGTGVRLRPILLYLVVAFGLAWAWWGQLILRGVTGPDRLADSHLPALLAPALAALLVRVVQAGPGGAIALLQSVLRPWQRIGQILGSLVLPVAAADALWLVAGDAGSVWSYPGIPPGTGVLAILLIALAFNAFGEEVGWRGFLLAHLAPLGRLRAALLVGLAWALWHAPAFFLPFGLGAHVSGAMILAWAISLMAGSVVLAWVWFASGGALGATILWHLVFNFATATEAMQGPPAIAASATVVAMAVPIARAWARRPGAAA